MSQFIPHIEPEAPSADRVLPQLQVFACNIFGPLFHHLFPERKFAPKVSSLSSNTTILTYVRLAYPMIKEDLMNAIRIPTLTVRQRTLLQNIIDLCDIFIPVVHFLIFIIYIYISILLYIFRLQEFHDCFYKLPKKIFLITQFSNHSTPTNV